MAVFSVAKLNSMQIKAALFTLNDPLTKFADLSKIFHKSSIILMNSQTVEYSKIEKFQPRSVSLNNLAEFCFRDERILTTYTSFKYILPSKRTTVA